MDAVRTKAGNGRSESRWKYGNPDEHAIRFAEAHPSKGPAATFLTDSEGRYHLRTVAPLGLHEPERMVRGRHVSPPQNVLGIGPAHIHFIVGRAGISRV